MTNTVAPHKYTLDLRPVRAIKKLLGKQNTVASPKHIPTLRPVRAIKKLCKDRGGVVALRNAMDGLGHEIQSRLYLKHASFDTLLTGLPRPALERILAVLRG